MDNDKYQFPDNYTLENLYDNSVDYPYLITNRKLYEFSNDHTITVTDKDGNTIAKFEPDKDSNENTDSDSNAKEV